MKRFSIIFLVIFSFLVGDVYADGNRWTSKPQIGSTINWEHPLSKGLVGAWLMNEGGGNKINNQHGLKNNVGTGISTQWQEQAIKFDGSTSYITFNTSSLFEIPPTNLVCFYFKFSFTSTVGTYTLFSKHETTPWAPNYYVDIANGYLHIYHKDPAGNDHDLTSPTLLNINTPYSAVILVDARAAGTIDSIVKLYINGRLDATELWANNWRSNTSTFRIGVNYTNALVNYYNGNIDFLYKYNRTLSPQEINTLYQDPYCFIKPPTIWSKFSTAVAAVRRMFIAQ